MAEESGDEGEKTEEPGQYRIDDFRSKGMVASSKEVTTVLVLFFSILTIMLSSGYMYEIFSEYFEWVLRLDHKTIFIKENYKKLIVRTVYTFLKTMGPILITVFVMGVLSNIMQFGFIFSTEVINLKWERINPIQGVKRLFSLKSLFESAKGILKFTFLIGVAYIFVSNQKKSLVGFLHIDLDQGFIKGKEIIFELLLSIIIALTFIAIIDFAWEKFQYRKKLLQTKQQAKEELKEKEGNPEVKQRIRSIQRELAQKRMMKEIPHADVVVTNPTHLSIIIKYDSEKMVAPTVIGKGADYLALKIREIAKQHNVPMVENVPLARTLYKTVKEGETIPRELYKTVAEILAFVYKLRKREGLEA